VRGCAGGPPAHPTPRSGTAVPGAFRGWSGPGAGASTRLRRSPGRREPLLIACDFDGTITQRDTLHVIVDAYGTKGIWEKLEPRLRAGEITVERAMEEEFALVRATFEQVRDLVLRHAPVRPGMRELVEWARSEGHRLVVLSSGFRCVIDVVLGNAGLGHLEVRSHDARFSAEGCRLVWSDRGERCALCNRRCKRHEVRLLSRGEPLVYLGDGISDRCAARMADVVFARAGLAEHLRAEGVPFHPFEDFFEVVDELRRRPGAVVRGAA
jgi:2-hydroxy-3-keto-5-methylthiopentenyl-1-phosphate phosphatase